MLVRYFYVFLHASKSMRDAANKTVKSILPFYNRARIQTIKSNKMAEEIIKLFEELKSLVKIDHAHGNTVKNTQKIIGFKNKLTKTMRFWPRDVLDKLVDAEDKQFLISMMTCRTASIGSVDLKRSLVEEKLQNFEQLNCLTIEDLDIPQISQSLINKKDAITNLCQEAMRQNFNRGDYRELVQLTLLHLSNGKDVLFSGFIRPGALHNARWMAKLLYSIKLVLLNKKISQLPKGTIFALQQFPKLKRIVQLFVIFHGGSVYLYLQQLLLTI